MPSYTNYSFDYYYLCTSLYIFSLGYDVIFLELSLKKWVSILEVAFRVVRFKWERKQIFSLSLKLFGRRSKILCRKDPIMTSSTGQDQHCKIIPVVQRQLIADDCGKLSLSE